MLHIPRWKLFLILAVCAFGFAYAMPNMLSSDAQKSWEGAVPSWLPTKTVNLGLDLRGGAHLLYEVDLDVVFDEQTDLLQQDIRSSMREARLRYRRLGTIERGVRIVLPPETDAAAVRQIIRQSNNALDITTAEDGLSIEAVMSEAEIGRLTDQTISQSIEIVRRRVDELGTTEPSIARQGDNRILLQVPGANAEDLKRIVGTTAKLTFHLVDDVTGSAGRSASTLVLPHAENGGRISVERRAMITGEMLENASPSFDQTGQAVVSFRLNSAGARRFCNVTRNNVNKPFAIVLDQEVISAPVIREPICGGSGQISGGFSVQTANDLALLLRAGALPAPLTVMEERTVGPSLGADSIEAGQVASIIALGLVLIFMVLAYGLFGLMANIALIVNVALIFALLSILQATLTLPGIAGIVLTIGMAVDANVLIFERIREEIHAGRSPISSVEAGYKHAMSTIVDSNLTTLIAAIILFSFGTGPIKGFAVTLGVGIITSFFSAIMVTRLQVVTWLSKKKPVLIPI